ncbi:MAG: hypothetical protein JNL16_07140 [Dechloromonas sp.]|nr:hypothetical protein [Dechloromonas sp.]
MKKETLTIPTKPMDEKDILPLCGMKPPAFFLQIDWMTLACMRKPLIKLSFDKKSAEDWLLYDQIEILAEKMDVDFCDAAHWGLRRALGVQFESARRMHKGRAPWNDDVRYICRIFALQLCNSRRFKNAYQASNLDNVIAELLVTDEELLLETASGNTLPI